MVLIELLRKGNIIKHSHIETMLNLRCFNVMTLNQRGFNFVSKPFTQRVKLDFVILFHVLKNAQLTYKWLGILL